ncbi:MAG: hypothetical protein KBB32_06870 [Spirochaetia bacterium]|nr:hypothetical protein [Spirochaetia bacterium]
MIMLLGGYLYLPMDPTIWLIGGIVLDLVLVVIGSLLWKKANDLDPPSGKNKLRFFLWNNMGVIVAVLAFFPLIIILLRDKKLDPKLKRIASIAAVVALAIAGLFSYDWNPVSAEQQASLQDSLSGQLVYWTPFGTRFHVDPNCPTLSRSATVYEGTIDQAFEANRGTPCQVCSSEYEVQLDGSPSTQP